MTFFKLYFFFFFLLTPFFVLSVYLTMTEHSTPETKKKLARHIAMGASGVCLFIFFFGAYVLRLFDITVDAFRAGSGVLLLLVAIELVYGKSSPDKEQHRSDVELLKDAIVPLAVPVTAGPATLGTLIVKGHELSAWGEKFYTAGALVLACWTIGLMLYFAGDIMRFLGRTNITIISKLTGLVLSAIALSMIVQGVHGLWG